MKRGFTLVELSIVLVIIGLLIGGILVGQSLIDAAKINAQIKQFQQYDIATSNFKQKFKQIPGDCSDAICSHSVWPSISNNNGKLDDSYTPNTIPSSSYGETGMFFTDLTKLLGIKPEACIGGGCGTSGQYGYGVKRMWPNAAIGRGGLAITGNMSGDIYYTFTSVQADGTNFPAFYSNMMAQGNFSPTEALAIDSKLDDGIPISGSTQSTSATVALASSIVPFTADTQGAPACINNNSYNATQTTNLCRLVVKSNYR